MMKTKLTKVMALFLALLMIAGSMSITVAAENGSTSVSSGATSSIDEVRELLNAVSYNEYAEKYADVNKAKEEIVIDAINYASKIEAKHSADEKEKYEVAVKTDPEKGECLYTPGAGSVTWEVEIPETAKYAIKIECYPDIGKAASVERILKINGKVPFSEARYIVIPKIWQNDYVDGGFEVIDGNHKRPSMSQVPEWREIDVKDSNGFVRDSFEFVLEAGVNTITLEAQNEPLTIKSITLYPYENLPTYEDVLKEYEAKGYTTTDATPIKIEAEKPLSTSTNTVYPITDRTSAITSPQDASKQLLNTIGGEKWQTVGQWVSYEFTVEKSGLYEIVPRYKQSLLDGMFVSRAIKIDGSYPFEEAKDLRFGYGSNWQIAPLNNGDTTFLFYLEEGTHKIELEVSLGDMADIIYRVESSLSTINTAYLTILRLTGANPDEYREYGFSRIMPDTIIDIIHESQNLKSVSKDLSDVTGAKGEKTATLDQVQRLLERMGGDEDEIAKNLENLKSYIGSLGTWISDAKTQPLEIDYILIQPAEASIPKANANFFASIAFEIKSFVMSFFTNYNSMVSTAEGVEEVEPVEAWLAYGRDQAQVIRNLINEDFSDEYKIPVNLKLVASSTLLPSVLAQQGPDTYIGLSEDNVINYAIRNAVLPLENYNTEKNPFEQVENYFNDAAMAVMRIEDAEGVMHTYGLPETQTFPMMFYRKDILADLGIEIPKTWDDVLAAIPVLQANNMQIGLSNDYRIFLYQMGGTLFADDGMRINLDSNVALESFDMMCSMFTMYSFPYKYDFANRFRTGEMPIGIASYTGTYNQLIVFATELKGLWEFVPLPGFVDEETGAINNVSISTSTAIVMMNGCRDKNTPEGEVTEKEKNTWDFMAWHVGDDCQQKYSNEMVAIMGDSAKHATANKFALEQLPWTRTEYENLKAQFDNLASIPNYPGSYIISRYTNFAFLAAFDDLANPAEEMLSYVKTINEEIKRKREEFGLETVEVGDTLADKRVEQAKAELGAIDNSAYKDLIAEAIASTASERIDTDGVTKVKIETLTRATAMENVTAKLKGANAELFANAIKYLEDASRLLREYAKCE